MATTEKDNQLLLQKIEGIISEYDKDNLEPGSLRDTLKEALKMPRKKNVQVKDRELEIARKMLNHYLEIENKNTDISITNFVSQLVEEYEIKHRNYSPSDIFKIYAKLEEKVIVDEISKRIDTEHEFERKAKMIRVRMIHEGLYKGQTIDEILNKPDANIHKIIESLKNGKIEVI